MTILNHNTVFFNHFAASEAESILDPGRGPSAASEAESILDPGRGPDRVHEG